MILDIASPCQQARFRTKHSKNWAFIRAKATELAEAHMRKPSFALTAQSFGELTVAMAAMITTCVKAAKRSTITALVPAEGQGIAAATFEYCKLPVTIQVFDLYNTHLAP